MKSTLQYSLANEVYDSEDAKELIVNLTAGTSHYHNLNRFCPRGLKGIDDCQFENYPNDGSYSRKPGQSPGKYYR